MGQSRYDLEYIANLIEPKSRVLDVGCGDGELLTLLKEQKSVDARGVEKSRIGVTRSVARGLSVIQGDADTDLPHYPDDSFDYVILTRTIQAMTAPRETLSEALRIAQKAIISFPNCGHWSARMSLALGGRMPHSRALPTPWYETENIHLCTLMDFIELCDLEGDWQVESVFATGAGKKAKAIAPTKPRLMLANLTSEEAIIVLSRAGQGRRKAQQDRHRP